MFKRKIQPRLLSQNERYDINPNFINTPVFTDDRREYVFNKRRQIGMRRIKPRIPRRYKINPKFINTPIFDTDRTEYVFNENHQKALRRIRPKSVKEGEYIRNSLFL